VTPVVQTNYGKHTGNCLTACVASVLDVPIESVPEFCTDGEWFANLVAFCKENGFFLVYWKQNDPMPIIAIGLYIILLLNLEGVEDLHAVVAKTRAVKGEDPVWLWHSDVVHDPNEHGYPPVKSVNSYLVIGKQ